MADKSEGMWMRLLTDWRVILLVICLLLSIIFIGPSYTNGQFTTNLKFGLDFEGGSTLKLQLINQSDPNGTISDATLEQTKSIMENKINQYGLKTTAIHTVRDDQGKAYMLIDFAGISYDQAKEIVGKQGKFEMRIQTTGNQSELILNSTDVSGVSPPTQFIDQDNAWGVSFSLSPEGAKKFQQACIQYGATTDPNSHNIIMLLDGQEFYDRPLSSQLAASLAKAPETTMRAMTGAANDATAQDLAKQVSVHMSAGSLPVAVQEVGSGQVPAEQGAMFKIMAIVAMVLAQLAIGVIMYVRYKEPRIILPMFLTSIFEVVIMLGAAVSILPLLFGSQWEIDLPSVAGIIAVIGTGVDQLIIITDEVMTTGKAPTTKKVLQKLTGAFKIIVSSAATVVVAMIPLLYMGFGSLKGFAIITILGVLIGILITRPAYGRIISDILNK